MPGLHITSSDGVATVTLDRPPLNLMDGILLPSLRGLIHQVKDDESVRVIVFESAEAIVAKAGVLRLEAIQGQRPVSRRP